MPFARGRADFGRCLCQLYLTSPHIGQGEDLPSILMSGIAIWGPPVFVPLQIGRLREAASFTSRRWVWRGLFSLILSHPAILRASSSIVSIFDENSTWSQASQR